MASAPKVPATTAKTTASTTGTPRANGGFLAGWSSDRRAAGCRAPARSGGSGTDATSAATLRGVRRRRSNPQRLQNTDILWFLKPQVGQVLSRSVQVGVVAE